MSRTKPATDPAPELNAAPETVRAVTAAQAMAQALSAGRGQTAPEPTSEPKPALAPEPDAATASEPTPAPEPAADPDTVSTPAPETDESAPVAPDTTDQLRASTSALEAARAFLEEAEEAFAAAERNRDRAAREEQARLDAEEDARIAALIAALPNYIDGAEAAMNRFRLEVLDLRYQSTSTDVMRRWIVASAKRDWVRRIQEQILQHANSRGTEVYARWDRKTLEWANLVHASLSRFKGGTRNSEEDDYEALAAANQVINEQSQAAPQPLNRDARDRSTPYPESLGLVSPSFAAITPEYNPRAYLPIDFTVALNEALIEAGLDLADDVFPRRSPVSNPHRSPSRGTVEAALRDFYERRPDELGVRHQDA